MDTIKKAFVLAGGNDQIELIKGLRARFKGIEIILIDMNPNVRAKEYADRMLVISTMDFNAVLEAAKREQIDLIISACGDQPMRTMAYVSEQLGLPCYLSYRQSENLTNKGLMKRKMIEGGIPTSKYKRIEQDAEIDIDGLSLPLVIKPTDNNGSKGIIKVYSKEEFDKAVVEAKRYTLGGDIIIEEFVEGEEYSVEAFIDNGTPIIVFPSKNEKIRNRNTFTICRNIYINKLDTKIEKQLKEIIKKIGEVFEINNVPLLIQFILKDDKVSVIEFSARTGGGSKLFFIREMVGVDVIDNLIDITINKKPNVTPKPTDELALINYIYTDPGVFDSIKGLEELKNEGIIKEAYIYKSSGTKILSSNHSSDRPAGVLIKGKTKEEINFKIKNANSRLKILDENGRDIMCHKIFEER